MMAASRGLTAVVELLLSKRVNIEATNKVTIDSQVSVVLMRYKCLDFDDYRDRIISIFIHIIFL